MTESLHQLVYYSRNLISDADQDAEITQILAASRRNNPKAGITGALLFNAGCFAQILEGKLPALEETFESIQQDERHGEVSLLALEPITGRSFADWAMGFVGASADNARRFAAIGVSSGFDPSRIGKDKLHAILSELVIEEEAAPL